MKAKKWKAIKRAAPLIAVGGLLATVLLTQPAWAATATESFATQVAPLVCTVVKVTTSVLFRALAIILIIAAAGLFLLGNSNAAKGLGVLVFIVIAAAATFTSWQKVFTGAVLKLDGGGDKPVTHVTDGQLEIICPK